MIAEHPVRQHLSLPVDRIDMLQGSSDLPGIAAAYRMNHRFMQAREYDIIIAA